MATAPDSRVLFSAKSLERVRGKPDMFREGVICGKRKKGNRAGKRGGETPLVCRHSPPVFKRSGGVLSGGPCHPVHKRIAWDEESGEEYSLHRVKYMEGFPFFGLFPEK